MLDFDTMDTTEFKLLDQTIINNSLTPLNSSTVDEEEYSNQEWYKEYKYKSAVFNCLDKHTKDLNKFGFTIDDAVKCLSSIINISRCNYRSSKTYFKVPSRVLCDRVQCSRERLNWLINILNDSKLLDIQICGYDIKIRVDRNKLLKDEYIKIKADFFAKYDARSMARIENKFHSHYYYCYNKRVQSIKETELAMGVTLAYNILLQENSNMFIHYRHLDNNNSILYAEAPIHLLSKLFKCSESKVHKKFIGLFSGSDYIKKHNKVYSDTKYINKEHQKEYISNPKHYLNNDYKSFALNKYYKMNDVYGNSFEETHPRVTPCSVIIFIDKFKETKIGKRVFDNMEFFKDVVRYLIQTNMDDPTLYRAGVCLTQEDTQTNNIIASKHIKTKSGISCVSINTLKKQYNNEPIKYKKRLKLFGNIDERSIESLLKFYCLACRRLANTKTEEFKYYINLLQEILDAIKYKTYKFFGSYICNTMDVKNRLKIVKTFDILKSYDNNFGLQINYKIQQQVKEEILNSDWYYNLGYHKEELDSLMDIKNISELITEQDLENTTYKSILDKEIYDIKKNINNLDLNAVELL